MSLPSPLRGIVPPLVTPLDFHGHLDAPALERLIEHILAGGVSGLFILGTTGEAASLPIGLKQELIERAVRQVRGRAPVLVGVTDTCVAKAIQLARHSARFGADAVVISAPYYLPLEQGELDAWVRRILDAQPLPIFLYNFPDLTGTAYEVQTVRRLSEIDRVVGIKDSSGNLEHLRQLRQAIARQDFSLLVGVEEHLAEAVSAGAHGCVAGGALILPRLFVDLHQAAANGMSAGLAPLQARVLKLGQIYRLAARPTAVVRGIKAALAALGICSPRMADPYRACTPDEMRQVRSILAELTAAAPA